MKIENGHFIQWFFCIMKQGKVDPCGDWREPLKNSRWALNPQKEILSFGIVLKRKEFPQHVLFFWPFVCFRCPTCQKIFLDTFLLFFGETNLNWHAQLHCWWLLKNSMRKVNFVDFSRILLRYCITTHWGKSFEI